MTETTRKLTLLDRCDRCNAAAKVVATKNGKELFFCSHHNNKFKNKLIEDEWDIQ